MSTKTGYIKNTGPQGAAFDDGPHIGGVIKFVCTRSPETSKNVSVTAYYYLGFGSYAASGVSYTGYKVIIYAWDNTWSSSTHPSKTINSSGTNWSCTSNTSSYFSAHSSDSNIDVKTKPAQKTGTIGSWTISNWTSGSRTFKFQMDDNGLQDTYTVSIAAPSYTSNVTATVVSADTSMGTVTGGGTYAPGTSVTIKATPKAGYKFKQWTYSDGWSGSNTNASVTFTVNSSGTATASFEPYTVTVSYHVNSGDIPDNPHKYSDSLYFKKPSDSNFIWKCATSNGTYAKYTTTITSATQHYNAYNYASFGLERTGYHGDPGAEWNTAANGSGTAFSQEDTTSNTTNVWTAKRFNNNNALTSNISVNLYARWVLNTWTIHFDGNGATSGSMADQVHTYGTALALTPNAFERIGYTFNNWNRAADGSGTSYPNQYSMSGTWTSTNGNTYIFYAQWVPNTTAVTFNPNGGSLDNNGNWGSDANTTNSHTCTLTYESGNYYSQGKATRTNYVFEGWNTKADGTGYNVYDANGSCTTNGGYWSAAGSSGKWKSTASTLTLYAKWRIKRTTWNAVTTSTGFGTVTGSGTYNYGSTITLTATPKSGYEFAQWTFYRNDTSVSAGSSSSNPWTAAASNYPDNSIYTATANWIPITDATIVDNNTWGQAENQWNNMNNMWVQRGEWKPVISAWVLINGIWRVVFGAGNSSTAMPIDTNTLISMSIGNYNIGDDSFNAWIRNKTDDYGWVYIDYNMLDEITEVYSGALTFTVGNYGTITIPESDHTRYFPYAIWPSYGVDLNLPVSALCTTSLDKNIRMNVVKINNTIGIQFLLN